jgi:hypothetical protein
LSNAGSHHDFGDFQSLFQSAAETGANYGIGSKTSGCIHGGGGSIPTDPVGSQQDLVRPQFGGARPIDG